MTAQEKISKARVAVAGLGGLGSNIAVSLARAGVGSLCLVDFDRVEQSNLNRQYYGMRHLGRYKTEALREVIAEIAPNVDITAECVRVTSENVMKLFGEEQIVCEAFDAPENKALLVNALLTGSDGCIVIAGSGMAGFGSANDIITKRVNSRLYVCGDGASGIGEGVALAAPRVAICANHMAHMALRLILEEVDP